MKERALSSTIIGLQLAPYRGPGLTVGGELNKLASNVAIGRNLAGVHWRSDATESLKLGEEVAIRYLREEHDCFNEQIDRAAAAREMARVLRPGGRLVASVWAEPEQCDIARFQQIASSFAPAPPVPGASPWALADPAPFLAQLAEAGIDARVETEMLSFSFDDFASAWETLSGVTIAQLALDVQQQAQAAVRAAMWPQGDGPRHFRNATHFITGQRR